MRRILIIALLALLPWAGADAQYDVSFAHYWAMEPSFNPAAVGKEAKLNAAAAYALQMAGFEHNPQTMYAAADMPFYVLRCYHGVGVQFINDAIGAFSHKRLALQYERLGGGCRRRGLGQACGAGTVGCGRGTVCRAVCQQRPSSTSRPDGLGCAADQTASEMQR